MDDPRKLLVIVGPTATGKSDLAVELALRFDGEIISADSRQVYKNLDIGTGKITKKEMRGVTHHLLDVADPQDKFTVADYKKRADNAVSDITACGKLPILCGGTGFYIESVIDDTTFPETPPNETLRHELRAKTTNELLHILTGLDPARAAAIDRQNPHRLIRAIEIASALGKVPERKINSKKFDSLIIGIDAPAEVLKKRIRSRLLSRIKSGMIEEAQCLHVQGVSYDRMEELGLEYRWLARYLQNLISKDEMIEKLYYDIWHYAKRQITWFKRNKKVHWIKISNTAYAIKLVEKWI